MNINDVHIIYTKNLIALCHILDEYEEFKNRLEKVLSKKLDVDFIRKLDDVSIGKFSWSIKVIEFYKQNKSVIDTINQYTNISLFINDNYDCELNEIDRVDYFYNYLKKHRDEMDKILRLLERLRELHIVSISLNENIDFSSETYEMNTWMPDNYKLVILDNMEAVPGYSTDLVRYKTDGSNYKITIGGAFGDLNRYPIGKITLNSLIFDVSRLPNYDSSEDVYKIIFGLKEEKEDEYAAIKTSVDLNVGLEDLHKAFTIISQRIENLEDSEKKQELTHQLTTIKTAIIKMQDINEQMDADAVSSGLVSNETLEKEKQLYKKERHH